jgi:hypothetical protein
MTPLVPAIVFLVSGLAAVQLAECANGDPPPVSAATEEVANSGRVIRERWGLRLVPEKCPEIDPALLGTEWSQRSVRDILGRGTDWLIRFPVPRGPQEGRSIELTTVQHYSVNACVPETVTTATHPLTLGGPFLEYDGLLHTAFVSAEVFVPDAILEVSDRRWYTAQARRIPKSKDDEPEVTLTEYLFEFDDDPITSQRGKLTLQRHVRKRHETAGDLSRSSSIFVRFRHEPDEAAPYELQIGTPEQRSLTAWFYAGRPYALLREQPLVGTGVFRRDKRAP